MEAVDIIENLNKCFRISVHKHASRYEDVEALLNFSDITIPNDYLSIVRVMTEVEILNAHQIQKYIPNSLAIGDDEGGMALIVMSGARGFGLYTVGFGGLDANDARFIAPSLSKFLIGAEGAEAF